jgi:hypothetical protein
MSINNAIFKSQPSTPMQAFASMRSTPFMEIDDKGGEVGTKICQYTKRERFGNEFGHGDGQRGSNIEEMRRIKILGQKKHTSRGSKLMNIIWLHLICAYSCARLHCISFIF